MSSKTRQPSHAGSWYTSNGSQLNSSLQEWLNLVHPLPDLSYDPPMERCKAIIAPHAGYSYSGKCAAWAYAAVPIEKVTRIFILGPSHHYHLNKIALTGFEKYGTPLGDLEIDTEVTSALKSTHLFSVMTKDQDEEEHSLEMHLPYVKMLVGEKSPVIKIVPLLVGNVSTSGFENYAKVLEPYWEDQGSFWIVSSDFCHWGTRFRHTPYYPSIPPLVDPVPPVTSSAGSSSKTDTSTSQSSPPNLIELDRYSASSEMTDVKIWESIQYMDHEGMDILRKGSKKGTARVFKEYLDRTENTICGRNPISLLLHILERQGQGPSQTGSSPAEIKFVRYEQSSQNLTLKDSSVSYVSGVVVI